MSPDQRCKRLTAIRDEIDVARRLTEVGWMASQRLENTKREALSELLNMILDKLIEASEELTGSLSEAA